MNKHDVLIAYISYTDDPNAGGKRRPALLIQKQDNLLHVLRITSKFHNKSEHIKKLYYPIKDWKLAGLKQESWIDIGAIRTIDADQLKTIKIGQLTLRDKQELTRFIKNYYRYD